MITILFKRGRTASSRFLLLFGLLILGHGALAQLDSVSVTLSFTQEATLDSTQINDSTDILYVEVYLDDIDFFGEVIVTVYDLSSGQPLAMIKSTKAELDSLNAISASVATIEFPGFPPIASSYRVDVLPRNFQGGNLPIISETY
ncbi:MAG: hypothetical protein NXI10_17150 [bacterium]|nr:hypothetical protein [bacterium]